ncbi:MAG TPA: hypothetical protein VMS74_15705 [Acidimicrobiia bacterium]|nr:hypothetical protein [Acidimicrobiia bacterium]
MAERQDDRWASLLDPAFTAAHRALVRLEDDEVPAALRPVRAISKAKTWPKPHRRLLVTHLDDEWLRTLALVELGAGSGPADRASRIFLDRAEGWEAELDEIASARTERREQRDAAALRTENQRLVALNDELSRRLRDTESELQDLNQRIDSDGRLEQLKKRLDEASRSVAGLEREVGERDAAVERIRNELAEADERINVLRARAAKASDGLPRTDSASRTFGRGRPVETARFLDELVEALRPRPGESDTSPNLSPLVLPPGVRPDTAAAVEWIRSIQRKVLLVVDGHNVAHDLEADPGRTARDRVVSEVARLRRLSDGPLSAVVFFDTSESAEKYSNFGVSVRYVPNADDAIEGLVAASDTQTIVVSTDRDVRARSARHGAVTLWGTALSAWIRGR